MSRKTAKVQPQQGSQSRSTPASPSHQEKAQAEQPSPSVHPIETKDVRSAGTNDAEQRRVLGMNVGDGQAKSHPENPAGQHATGSFTGRESAEQKER